MNFCPKCGTLLHPLKEEGQVKLTCKNCGYQEVIDRTKRSKFIVKKEINHSPREKTLVIDETKEIRVMPTVKARCPKCGNDTAYYWQVQTRRADEGSTTFLRCTVCKHTWRIY
ncbi:MAG: transcription factor S [Candidatus Freyarchaeota archaeon]